MPHDDSRMADSWMVEEHRWIEAGRGEPVVLLHGLLGAPEHWDATLEALGPGWRGLALLLPIFDLPADDLSIRRLARHVCEFLDAQRIAPAVIVGNSLGGQVALDLAWRYPDRVRALVLTGSAGLLERSFTRGVPHRPSELFVRLKMEEIFHDGSLVTPEWVESIRALVNRRSYALRLLQISRSAKREQIEPRLGEIRCPTLLLWGREDRITPPEVGLRFLGNLPRAEIRFIANCGHAPMLEQPAVFAEHLTEFLDSLPPVPVSVA
jgi:pimeloyl-ACP methyl ester carboxylesterase